MAAKLVATVAAGDHLGEGPVWNPADGRLWWTDIHGRRLRNLDLASGAITDMAMVERVGCFALVADQPDQLLVAFESGFGLLDLIGGEVRWLERPELGDTGRRFNDGRVDRQGRFWAGTMVENGELAAKASAALWRVDASLAHTVHETGVQISNGLAFSPDGRTLYFADSPHQRIFAYDLDPDTGAISGKRLFVQVERGYPDGATVDSEGCLWSARWGAGEVVRHAPDGREIAVVKTPALQPTCPAFGGADFKTLFVTSATEHLTPAELAEQPSAGDLFVFEADVPGLPECAFKFAPAPPST
jgi:sugar lactone lactonase YvrE